MDEIVLHVKNLLKKEECNIIAIRRIIHENPELSMKEFETTKRIASELNAIGIPYKIIDNIGIIADINASKKGPKVLLRADIDALPIQEENNISYKSKNDGVMHACGHDAHAAMLLGACKALWSIKDQLNGSVRFVFQPGEETGEGALKMIDAGVLDAVDSVMGLHINSAVPKGVIYCPPGEMMAASDSIDIEFRGQKGHGARPNEGIDSVLMGSAFVMNAQSIISREISPIDSAVVTFGTFNAGEARNIISDVARITGTVRTFNDECRTFIQAALERYAKCIAKMYRGEVEFTYKASTPPLINSWHSTDIFYDTIAKVDEGLRIDKTGKKTGSEDFAYYLHESGVPGVFAFLGARSKNPETHHNHHTGRFNIDESVFIQGSLLYTMYAYNYINK
ncbi:M20 family metallopeptidase [uncultured Veillonella sp.]|uniref:M20 metallopeptidase family protein n=1 Tax=uncultured Veillonella sp. TaxID=159268 RepID=UPI0025E08925|nr:amidohydrolase [uncultured Veillonella sp.]